MISVTIMTTMISVTRLSPQISRSLPSCHTFILLYTGCNKLKFIKTYLSILRFKYKYTEISINLFYWQKGHNCNPKPTSTVNFRVIKVEFPILTMFYLFNREYCVYLACLYLSSVYWLREFGFESLLTNKNWKKAKYLVIKQTIYHKLANKTTFMPIHLCWLWKRVQFRKCSLCAIKTTYPHTI